MVIINNYIVFYLVIIFNGLFSTYCLQECNLHPIYDQFGRITIFIMMKIIYCVLFRDPNPRRAYWKNGELIGPPFHYFRQIRYFPQDEITPNLILALEGAIVDCGLDVHNMLCRL